MTRRDFVTKTSLVSPIYAEDNIRLLDAITSEFAGIYVGRRRMDDARMRQAHNEMMKKRRIREQGAECASSEGSLD
jgi:hypothetical protein